MNRTGYRRGNRRLSWRTAAAWAAAVFGAHAAASELLPVQWVRPVGQSGFETGAAVKVDPQGNSYLAGMYRGPIAFDGLTLTNAGDYDLFLAKFNPSGNVLWARRAGGPGEDYPINLAVDAQGNVAVTGYFKGRSVFGGPAGPQAILDSGSIENADLFVARYSSDGNLQWAMAGGGPGHDTGVCAAFDAAGRAHVVGVFSGTAVFGGRTLNSAGQSDVVVLRLGAGGGLDWARRAGGSDMEWGQGIHTTGDGAVYITGFFTGPAAFGSQVLPGSGGRDIFLARLDAEGSWSWAVAAGGSGTDYGFDLAASGSSAVFVAGYFTGQANFGGQVLASEGQSDWFVARYATNGTPLWVRRGGGWTLDEAWEIDANQAGDAYVAGYITRSATFESSTVTSRGDTDIAVACYGAAGDLRWVRRAGGVYGDSGQSIAVDPAGRVVVSGMFSAKADFGLADGTTIQIANQGGAGAFIARLAEESPPDLPPRLSIARAGSQVSVQWPAPAAGYQLESNQVLHGAGWQPVQPDPTVMGGTNRVDLPVDGRRFFRLRR
ncbi:MAG TPA: hypothetical protein P5555_08950 [Candidatus Paceibacterota bacterium]|nr:hypothetical protein [Verrucomicrobiota bacterium]HRZ45302.1 hypothetical protein [Candidatus Paceibacterota bacterium]